jgi:signal transduction histidine kinase
MNVADFIEHDIDHIVCEWVEFARSRLPTSHSWSFEDLADHAKVLLLAIAEDIGHAQGAQRQHDKSQGQVASNAPDITRIARDHAAQRFAQGFSLDHLISEFRALRASVIRRWTKQLDAANMEALEDLTRFGEAMDQALTESASLYSVKVDHSRNLLLGVLGHDLRTPLGVVHMTANYLLRRDTLGGTETKAVARILTSAERMKAMVDDILDFTRTALGVPLPVAPAPANIGDIAVNIVGEVRTLHPESKVEVSCDGALLGNWDAARIGQMLSNLISNAVQHGDREKPVTVKVSGEADEVVVRVHNEGQPIPLETRKNLFTPLRHTWSAEAEANAGSSGLGLGLYISRTIAEAHGGSIDVSSDEQGTAFLVRLPRAPAASAQQA